MKSLARTTWWLSPVICAVLLSGWVKDKKGKAKEERREIERAKALLAEMQRPSTKRRGIYEPLMGRSEQKPKMPVDLEVLQESALAMAQATLQNAMDASGLTRSELADRMSRPRSYLSRMMSGSHNLTIKTFARALAACGFEAKFEFTPIQWGWAQSTGVATNDREEEGESFSETQLNSDPRIPK